MGKLIFIPAIAAVALGWAGVHAVASSRWASFGASTFQLVMTYKGDAFVLDHGMTRTDCFEAMPMSDPAKGLSFQCQAEG